MLIVLINGLIIFFFPGKYQLYSAIHLKFLYNVKERKYISEGLDGIIVTYSYKDSLITCINGMYHGGRPGTEFYFETIEALSYKKQIKNILIIGFGTGSTTETILHVKPKPQITLVELSPTLIQNLNQINYLKSLLKDDGIKLIYADGRKYLYNNKEKFDAIFMDPLRTTTSFSNNLYSKQFFELINNRLSSDGIFMVWMDEYHIIPKTLCSVFPFVNQYSYFCVASSQELKQDTIYKNELFNRFPQIYQNLIKIDSEEPNPISKAKILENNINYPINEDYKPRCEFFVGMHFFKH